MPRKLKLPKKLLRAENEITTHPAKLEKAEKKLCFEWVERKWI